MQLERGVRDAALHSAKLGPNFGDLWEEEEEEEGGRRKPRVCPPSHHLLFL